MARYVVLGRDGQMWLVKVSSRKEFQQTIRYLEDCGIQFNLNEELEPMTPGELSDILAPRDE